MIKPLIQQQQQPFFHVISRRLISTRGTNSSNDQDLCHIRIIRAKVINRSLSYNLGDTYLHRLRPGIQAFARRFYTTLKWQRKIQSSLLGLFARSTHNSVLGRSLCNDPVNPIQSRLLMSSGNSEMHEMQKISIGVRSIAVNAVCGLDAFMRPQQQPLLISFNVSASANQVESATRADQLCAALDYSRIEHAVRQAVQSSSKASLSNSEGSLALSDAQMLSVCARSISDLTSDSSVCGNFSVTIRKPQALNCADALEIGISQRTNIGHNDVHDDVQDAALSSNTDRRASLLTEDWQDALVNNVSDVIISVQGLQTNAVIGVRDYERVIRQPLKLNIRVTTSAQHLIAGAPEKMQRSVSLLEEFITKSSFMTIERLCALCAEFLESTVPCTSVEVHLSKPRALSLAHSPECTIRHESAPANSVRKFFLGLGSNIGDSVHHIKSAVEKLSARGLAVTATAPMYLTMPQDYVDQDPFINTVIQVETMLSAKELLDIAQNVEKEFKRAKTVEKGPRTIDIDLLCSDPPSHSATTNLKIPHPRMFHREFVVRPLEAMKYAPITAVFKETLSRERLRQQPAFLIVPLRGRAPLVLDHTLIMGVVNVTPDSFSDAGLINNDNIVDVCRQMLSSGADILDIGGCSTKPSSESVSEDEELARVIPAITRLRSEFPDAIISIDTFRSRVARKAVEVGADMINDISGGLIDPDILNVAASTQCPICLGHIRGTPATMNKQTQYADIVNEVASELQNRLAAAEASGIRRWNILLDPGFGFAKKRAQNYELLQRIDDLKEDVPWVIGTSRKRFLGPPNKRADRPQDRNWESAAAVAMAVRSSRPCIVRVHDVAEISRVCRVIDRTFNRRQVKFRAIQKVNQKERQSLAK